MRGESAVVRAVANLIVVSAAVLCGCGKRVERPVVLEPRPAVVLPPGPEGAFVVGNGSDPSALDPHVTNGIPEYRIQRALFEGLLADDPGGGPPVPAVAERWEVSPDGRTWTFHLRADARWSDGTPVEAEDFAWSWRRAMTPSLGNPYQYLYAVMAGYREAVRRWEAAGGEIDWTGVGVEVVDARTLVVRLEAAAAHFPRLLTVNAFFPVKRAAVEAAGDPFRRGTGWDRPGRLVGNGPYVLERWETNRRIVLRVNPHHRDAAVAASPELVFVPIGEPAVEEMAFLDGQMHVTQTVPANRIPFYRREAPGLLRVDPYLGTYYLSFNTRRPPLDDPRVRRALGLALDRAALVEGILRGGQAPARTFVFPGAGGYVPIEGPEEDLRLARELLAEAGYPEGRGMRTLTYLFNTSEAHRAVAEALQDMWRRGLGVEVELQNEEWKTYLARRFSFGHDIARAGWIALYDDPRAFLELFVEGGGNNDTQWSDRAYEELLERAAGEQDTVRRHAFYREAEALLLEAAPVLPLYFYTQPILLRPEVTGWVVSRQDRRPWQSVGVGMDR